MRTMILCVALLCPLPSAAGEMTEDGRLRLVASDGDKGVLDFVCEGDQLRAELRYHGCLGVPGAVSVVEMRVEGGMQALQRWTFDAEGEALTFAAADGLVGALVEAQAVAFDAPREGGRAITRFSVEGLREEIDQLPCAGREGS